MEVIDKFHSHDGEQLIVKHYSSLNKCEMKFSLFLPPASTELNPIEQVWRQLREDSLANRCFKDFDDVVDACCDAWNVFSTNIDQVKSLCHGEWDIIRNRIMTRS